MLIKEINFDKAYGAAQRGAGGYANSGSIQLPAEDTLSLMKQHRIYKEDILANTLGAYAIAEKVKNGTAYWASVDNMKYVTTARPSNCSRTAITRGDVTSASKAMTKMHIFLKFCSDTWTAKFDSRWQALWGAGNDLNDINSTEGGRALFSEYTNTAVEAIGSDFSEISWLGNHSIIAATVAADPLTLGSTITTAITATLSVADGWLKQIDALKTASYPHINNDIGGASAWTISGDVFTGDAIALIQEMRTKAKPKFATAVAALKESAQYPIVFVTGGIFNRLKEQLITANPALASQLCWSMNGKVAAEMGIELSNLVTWNAFPFDGNIIVNRPDWDASAQEIGFYHHRALQVIPGTLGIAIDVEEMEDYGGMGLVITKSPTPTDGGAYFLETNYQIATAILKNEHMVNYSYMAVRS